MTKIKDYRNSVGSIGLLFSLTLTFRFSLSSSLVPARDPEAEATIFTVGLNREALGRVRLAESVKSFAISIISLLSAIQINKAMAANKQFQEPKRLSTRHPDY